MASSVMKKQTNKVKRMSIHIYKTYNSLNNYHNYKVCEEYDYMTIEIKKNKMLKDIFVTFKSHNKY